MTFPNHVEYLSRLFPQQTIEPINFNCKQGRVGMYILAGIESLHAGTPVHLPAYHSDIKAVLKLYAQYMGLTCVQEVVITDDVIGDYDYLTKAKGFEILLYSAGVESEYLRRLIPRLIPMYTPGIDYLYPHGVETPSLVLAAIMAPGATVYTGNEYEYLSVEHARLFPYHFYAFRIALGRALGIRIKTPLIEEQMTKLDCLKELVRIGHAYSPTPCFNAEPVMDRPNVMKLMANVQASGHLHYCGECFKCWTMKKMFEHLNVAVPFRLAPGVEEANDLRAAAYPSTNNANDARYYSVIESIRRDTK